MKGLQGYMMSKLHVQKTVMATMCSFNQLCQSTTDYCPGHEVGSWNTEMKRDTALALGNLAGQCQAHGDRVPQTEYSQTMRHVWDTS